MIKDPPQKLSKDENLPPGEKVGGKKPAEKRISKKEKEKEGRSVGPILLLITIVISYLILVLSS